MIQENSSSQSISTKDSVIECVHLKRVFDDLNGGEIVVLEDVSLSVKPKEMIAVIGASGSGKTTLLQLLGGLDMPTSGEVYVDGLNVANVSDSSLSQLRNQKLGFVFQFHHLLPELSALENVMMPLYIAGLDKEEALSRGEQVLRDVGLDHRINHKPAKLSGGERQRTAIARAVVNRPLCLLADEPTGNLDGSNAEKIMELIEQLNESYSMSVVLNTHDQGLAKRMHHTLAIRNGLLQPHQS